MDILIAIVLVIVFLIVTFLIVALFVRKEYAIEREIIIGKPKDVVFNYVKYQKNQDHYSKWVMTDPNMKKEFKGADGTVGFIYAWDGNDKAGKGEQEIKNLKEGERIDLEVRFIRPFESTAYTHMVTEPASANTTKVKWGMVGKSKYPMNVMNLFMNHLLGKDLQISFVNLKNILENKSNPI